MYKKFIKASLVSSSFLALLGCGGFGSFGVGDGGVDGARSPSAAEGNTKGVDVLEGRRERGSPVPTSILDALSSPDENTNVRVNKYLWNASLETLSFLPVDSADPFTGVLVMGWGRAPGSSRQYRATVLVQDPALDARSLKVSVQTRSGVASAETVRRIEDAILTRARQLRVRDKNL